MKTPHELLHDIERRLTRTWHTDLTGDTNSWPHKFPIGNLTKTQLEEDFATIQQHARQWREWANTHQQALTTSDRKVHGTLQNIPTHITIDTLTTAATLTGTNWTRRLHRNQQRLTNLTNRFPHTVDPARLLRGTDTYNDTDFDLLLTTADWFTHNDATGYTPRQVPVEGIHAKWLNTHQPHILALTGHTTLNLLPNHPPRIHFTYLDPHHRTNGGRWHDSATVGDTFTPAYQPTIVLISENKDTAIHFPPTPGAISIEGAGYGGTTAATFPWLTHAPHLYYWGDIDTHGYEILNGYRQAGVPVTSILMDTHTYDTYQRYGTNRDKNGNPITAPTPKPLPLLTDNERAVYENLTNPNWPGNRRIEQERIPLDIAHATTLSAMT